MKLSLFSKYASLLGSFFRASAVSDLEYRLNITIKIFTDIIWYAAQLAVFEVLFQHTRSISGWTLESTRVFMGVLFVVDGIWMILFSENLDRFSDKVRKGELDLLLAKPVNSQFMISFQKMNTAYIGNVMLATSWMIWSITQLPTPMEWWRLSTLLVLIPCGLAISYSCRFFFSVTALIFTRAENINYVWYQLYRLGTRPDSIYPAWLRYAILTIVPVAFLASVPSRMIVDTPDLVLFFGAIAVAVIFVYLSTRYWSLALRKYSSASS